jgi:hypothetical protein
MNIRFWLKKNFEWCERFNFVENTEILLNEKLIVSEMSPVKLVGIYSYSEANITDRILFFETSVLYILNGNIKHMLLYEDAATLEVEKGGKMAKEVLMVTLWNGSIVCLPFRGHSGKLRDVYSAYTLFRKICRK